MRFVTLHCRLARVQGKSSFGVGEWIADEYLLKLAQQRGIALDISILLTEAQKMGATQIAPGIKMLQQRGGPFVGDAVMH